MARVRIHLTGELRVEVNGAPVDLSLLSGERTRLAFAFLLLSRGRVVTRDELAEAIWGERLPPTWKPALRNVLTKVRAYGRSAGVGLQLVRTADGCYRLDLPASEVEIDLTEMERSLKQAAAALAAGDQRDAFDLAAAARAIALRPCVQGLEGEWIDEVRADQRAALAAALRLMAEATLHADPGAAVAAAHELIEVEPLSEEGYRLLMRAHMGVGNRVEALSTYMACRAALADQLGVDPSAETHREYLRILRTDEGEEDLRRTETRFIGVRGARIAYQTAGSGAFDIVFVPGTFTHVDTIWQDAGPAAFFSRFLGAARLVFFDPAGTGASDEPVEAADSDLPARRSEEIDRVLEAVASRRPVLVASLDGGPGALRFAATYPERVAGLVLANTTARWLEANGYSEGLSAAAAKEVSERLSASWGTEEFAAHAYPTLRSDRRFLSWYARLQRTMVSPAAAALALRRLQAVDERALLGKIVAPTLVLHRREHPAFPLAQGRYLAEHIPGAILRVLEGSEGFFGEDSASVAAIIREFALQKAHPRMAG